MKTASFEIGSVLALVTGRETGRPTSAALLGVLRRRLLMRQQDAVIASDGGYLLVQRGQPIAAINAGGTRLTSWTHFEDLIAQVPLQVFYLSALQAAVVFAALDGQQWSQSQTVQGHPTGQLAQVQADQFSGLLIITLPDGCGIWALEQGVIAAEERWAGVQFHLPTLQIAWTPRLVPPLPTGSALPPTPPVVPPFPLHSSTPDTRQVWQHFHRFSQLHLGDAADRITRQMWQHHSEQYGAELLDKLAQQVERFAGPAAAQHFLHPLSGSAASAGPNLPLPWEMP